VAVYSRPDCYICNRRNSAEKEVTMEIWTHNITPIRVTIDDDDYSKIAPYVWRKYPSCRYVQAWANNKTTAIHRIILDAPDGMVIDHINGDTTDNRKVNLRICQQKFNMRNRKPNKNGRSAYRGITVMPGNKYRAKINCDKTRYDLGVYYNEHDAVIAYNAAAKILYGEFAYMNDIPEYPSEQPKR
jgi:hypothetical protein